MKVKNFLKFNQYSRKLNLKANQTLLLQYLFETTNMKFGYSFVSFENMMEELNISSKATVNAHIKSLEKAGFITVNRENKNNRYYIVGIEQFLVESKVKKTVKKTKEVAKKTIEKVEEIATEIAEEVKEVVETVVEEVNAFIPSFNMNNANVVEEEVVVANVPEVEEIDPMVQSLMNQAKEEQVEGGTYKDYEYLTRRYDISDIRIGIGYAVACAKEGGKAYFSKIKTYLEELDKKRSSFVPMW